MPDVTHFGCMWYIYGFNEDGIDPSTSYIIWDKRILVESFPVIIPVANPPTFTPPSTTKYIISGGTGLSMPDVTVDRDISDWLTNFCFGSTLWRKSPFFATFQFAGLDPAGIATRKFKLDSLVEDLREEFDCVVNLMDDAYEIGFSRFAIWDGVVGHNAFSAAVIHPNDSQEWVDTETGEIIHASNYWVPFYAPDFNGQHWNDSFWYIYESNGSYYLETFHTQSSWEYNPWLSSINSARTCLNGRPITEFSFFAGLIENYDPDSDDHYVQIGEPSGESGNDPHYNRIGDDIEFAEVPTLDAIDTGFVTLYAPTSVQNIRDLATYMWDNSLFDVSNWKKIFADPMEAILGLSLVPFPVPVSGVGVVSIGNLTTNVSMGKVNKQWIEVDCGSMKVNRYWGTYLDYDPYTQVEIYLPYIGTKPLRADDIMNSTISVRYIVDIISGACVAEIKSSVVNSRSSVLYRFSGMCTAQLPISGNSYDNILTGVTKLIGGAFSGLVSTGLGNPMGAVGGMESAASGLIDINKPHIDRSGGVNSTSGFLSTQKPVLIFTFPRACVPANQSHYTGYPSFITENLSNLSGYTEIEKIHIEGFTGTEPELAELESLLKGGVMF